MRKNILGEHGPSVPYFETSGGVKLYYIDLGSGEPVVFLHGRGFTHEFYEYQTTELAERYRVLAYDSRGHGDSDKPNSSYSHDEFAGDLREFVDGLGLRDVNLVGASTGSFVIQNYVKRYGVDGLASTTLISTTPVFAARPDFAYGFPMGRFDEIKKNLKSNHPKAVADFIKFLFRDEPDPNLMSWMFNLSMKTPLYVLLKTLESNIQMDYRGELAKFTKPTLILQGRYDRLCPLQAVEYMKEQIPNSRLVLFEQSGHVPYIEEKDKLTRTLSDFIARN